MPNLGADWPSEFDNAAARADIPGPGTEEVDAAPARGAGLWVREPSCPIWPGVGIWRIWGVSVALLEGTGEANRAIDVALVTESTRGRPLAELGEDDIGTGSARESGLS